MIRIVIALVFLVGSMGIMIGILIVNQIYGTYGSALSVPVYNLLCLILAVVGLGLSVVAHHKNKEMALAKRTVVFGLTCVIILAVLFPFANSGALSVMH